MARKHLLSNMLEYLAEYEGSPNGDESVRIPSLDEIKDELGISVSKLREQLEVARALGIVEVRPRTGIIRKNYSFTPAVLQSLRYAVTLDPSFFEMFSSLRKHVEGAYWLEAVEVLQTEDHALLQDLMTKAWDKLRGHPIKIPHSEHRQLHLTVFHRLENPFVLGILEAFWDAYEVAGLNLYADYGYLQEVWSYHQKMVDAICEGDFEASHQAFIQHTDLLYHRPEMVASQGISV